MPAESAEGLARNPAVDYYERDGVAYALQSDGQTTDWGVERVHAPAMARI